MDDRELGSDGEDILCLSGTSSVEDETVDDELEFDMWEGQFSLAAALPSSRKAPWFSTSDLNSHEPTFDRYLAGNIKNGTLLLSPGANNDMTVPPPRMTRSLQHMPSFFTQTMEERIQSEVDSLLDEMDAPFDEDTVEILTRNRIMSFSSQMSTTAAAAATPPSVRKMLLNRRQSEARRQSDAFQMYSPYYNGSGGLPVMHLSDNEEYDDFDQKRVQSLQDQVGKLAESQASTDGRYSIVRQENVTLNQKILALQEQLSEMEQRSEKELADEQKRNRELLARIEREKQLEIENYSIRLQSMERDYNNSAREVIQLRSANDRLKAEKNSLEQELFETQQSLTVLQKEFSQLQDSNKREQEQVVKERRMNEHLVEELSKELETLKSSSFPRGMAPSLSNGLDGHSNSSPASMLNGIASASNGHNSHINDLEDELKVLREKNRRLKEANDELEAVLMNRSLEQGKAVLSQTNREGTSIEMELRNMDDNQDFSDTPFNFEEFCQLRTALKEQQDVNAQLRGYIDGILMNIIDKYPELLEVRK